MVPPRPSSLTRRVALRTPALAALAAVWRPGGASAAGAAAPARAGISGIPGIPGLPEVPPLIGSGGEPSTVDVNEPRYLGYSPADRKRPYADFMESAARPAQDHLVEAYWGPQTPTAKIPPLSALADDLNGRGYSAVENGYGSVGGSQVWAAALTRMPGVTAAMWDWWFGWHSSESARYRLWHPDSHAYAALRHDRTTVAGLTDRQRYVGNTSYVDEFIGGQLEQLAITFLDPASAGLRTSHDVTVVYGRVASSQAPLSLGVLAHQVRPVRGGAEMRSRFYLNVPGLADLDLIAAQAAHNRGDLPQIVQRIPFTVDFARSLMEHCGREMNHLARFLPDLYAQRKRL